MNTANVNPKLLSNADSTIRGLAMSNNFDLIMAARSDACVLLTGKTETIQAMAYQIHSLSGWRHGPFTIVECGWPEARVESVLFGVFPEGEPSPAQEAHPRLAQAGTVLLQDVGRLSAIVQSRLADRLMALRGNGGLGRARRRLMASSSEPLLPRVLDGTFDDRLFYRLNVIHLIDPDGEGGHSPPDFG